MRQSVVAVSLSLSVGVCLCLALTGCSLSPSGTLTATSSAVTLHGSLHGGQQPVAGARIYVMTPTAPIYGAGPGPGSLLMLNANVLINEPANSGQDSSNNYIITTAADGSFSITFGSDYDCANATDQGGDPASLPGTEPVYLYAKGGDSGAGDNEGLGFLASLGPCNTLTSSTQVFMNEMTTVAMAYAVAGYAVDATDISSNGSTLAITGIDNAFANTTNLVDLPTGTPLATTPAGNGTVPTAEITTLANILAACVNSTGTGSPSCQLLVGTATSDGTVSGTSASDTATAAIYIAHNPGANVTTLFGIPGGTPAFSGGLTTQPNDFTIALLFTGGGIQPSGEQPHAIAVDATGNVWAASITVLSEFSPLGLATSFGSANGVNLTDALNVAVSADSTQIWIPDYAGGVTDFSVSGSSGTLYATASGSQPSDVAIDGSGNLYLADAANSQLIEMDGSGNLVGTPVTGNGLVSPTGVAIQAGTSGNIWVGNYHSNNGSVFTNNGASAPTARTVDTLGSVTNPVGLAIDANGAVWTGNQNNTVSRLSSDGSTGTSYTIPGSAALMDGVAIDGAGNVWATDQGGDTVFELNNAGTVLNGTTGYPPVNGDIPDAVAVDGSGDVWYTTQSSNSLYELLGAAVPVATPIAYGVTNTLLGVQPNLRNPTSIANKNRLRHP